MFELFDTDGSGTVDEEELADAMVALGLGDDTNNGNQREAARRLMDQADTDGSRTVDLNEFKALMQETTILYLGNQFSSLPLRVSPSV